MHALRWLQLPQSQPRTSLLPAPEPERFPGDLAGILGGLANKTTMDLILDLSRAYPAAGRLRRRLLGHSRIITLLQHSWHARPHTQSHCVGGPPVSARGAAQGRIGLARVVNEVQEMTAHHRFAASKLQAAALRTFQFRSTEKSQTYQMERCCVSGLPGAAFPDYHSI